MTSRKHGIARLLQEVRPHAAPMCAGALCLAVATLGELAIMRACGTAVDLLTTATPASEGAIDAAVGWLMAMFGVVAVFRHLGEYALRAAGEGVVARVSKELLSALLREEVAAHDATTVGALTSVLSLDVLAIRHAVARELPDLVRHAAASLCATAGMLSVSVRLTATNPIPNPKPKPNPDPKPKPKPKRKPNQVRLTATGALVGPLIGLLIAAHGSRVKRLAREQHAQLARTAARAAETLSAVRPIKACGCEGWNPNPIPSPIPNPRANPNSNPNSDPNPSPNPSRRMGARSGSPLPMRRRWVAPG